MTERKERMVTETIRLQERQTKAEGKGVEGKEDSERMFEW